VDQNGLSVFDLLRYRQHDHAATLFSFIAYIDESGGTGLEIVKPIDGRGATEWLVLSCFLVRAVNDHLMPTWVRDIQSQFKNVQSPHLHFADLPVSISSEECDGEPRYLCPLRRAGYF